MSDTKSLSWGMEEILADTERKYKLKDMGDNDVLNVSIEPGL